MPRRLFRQGFWVDLDAAAPTPVAAEIGPSRDRLCILGLSAHGLCRSAG